MLPEHEVDGPPVLRCQSCGNEAISDTERAQTEAYLELRGKTWPRLVRKPRTRSA